jgi:hypothetical protein
MFKTVRNNKQWANDVNVISKGRGNAKGKNPNVTHKNGLRQKKEWQMDHPNMCPPMNV